MKKISIYFIAVMFFVSCGRNSDKSVDQVLTTPVAGISHEQMTQLQEQAVKEKYLKKGREIATFTQAELLKAVQGAMASGGPDYAIAYCNLEALDLKDSLSNLNNCRIQRLSMKYRNPADRPVTEIDMEQLESYMTLHGNGETLTPSVYIVGDKVEYFQPIIIGSGACLLCHGEPLNQIAKETLSIIKKHYPNDLATGYKMNDFRGVWKITFLN